MIFDAFSWETSENHTFDHISAVRTNQEASLSDFESSQRPLSIPQEHYLRNRARKPSKRPIAPRDARTAMRAPPEPEPLHSPCICTTRSARGFHHTSTFSDFIADQSGLDRCSIVTARVELVPLGGARCILPPKHMKNPPVFEVLI